jgi:hypothetical protein
MMQQQGPQEGDIADAPGKPSLIYSGGRWMALKDFDLQQEATKARGRVNSQEGRVNTAQNMLGTIREAKGLVGPFSTGFLGPAVKEIGGTNAANLDTKVDTMKANLAFDRLQEMRDNSPTGGAVGNVTERELDLLASTVASLKQKQSPEEFRNSLEKIERHYTDIRNRLGYVDAFKTPQGASAGPPNPRARPGGNRPRPVHSTSGALGGLSDDDLKRQLGL